MPQISLYIDKSTLKKVEVLAKIERKSISKWVRTRIENSIEKNWPENYFLLFGSVSDQQLKRPEEIDLQNDTEKEIL